MPAFWLPWYYSRASTACIYSTMLWILDPFCLRESSVKKQTSVCKSYISHFHILYDKRRLCTYGVIHITYFAAFAATRTLPANVRQQSCVSCPFVFPVQSPDASLLSSPLLSQAAAWLSLICHQIIYTKFTCIVCHSSCCRFVRWNKSLSTQVCVHTPQTLLVMREKKNEGKEMTQNIY